MTPNGLVIEPYKRAVASLEEAFLQTKSVWTRDAAIQRFEYTFELAIKMMKRALENALDGNEIDQWSYRELCRRAAEAGLIDDVEAWFGYRESRNITSHTYDEDLADEVYDKAKEFAPAARKLLEALEKKV